MADYAISNVDRRIVYTGSAGVGPYAFNFEVLDQTDIAVYKNATLLVLTTNYTVSINPITGVGSVTLNVAATSSDTITIVGARAIQRTTDFTTGGDLFANSLNDELDSLTIFSQQVAETAERGIKAPVTDPTNINMTLPGKADRIDSLLKFDLNGNPGVISVTDFVSGFSGAILGANYVTTNATGNGSTTAFTVSSAPGDKGNIQIYLDGVYQNKNTFSISGTTVTFTEAPPVGSAIEFVVGYSLGSTSGADAVTYTPAGTGAQTTTVQAKLRQTVSTTDFGAVGNGTTDDTAAVQAAVTYCVANNFDLLVDGLCLLTAPINIDRIVDGPAYDTYFTISSISGGGFKVSTSINMFSSSLPYTNTPVTQLVKFQNLRFESNESSLTAYVLDGNKFLRTQFSGCSFRKIRCLTSDYYVQSIYFFECQMRRWEGVWFLCREACYDIRFEGNLAEAGTQFALLGTDTQYKGPNGCVFINNCIEGMLNFAIQYGAAAGLSITGNYFEANGIDIDGRSISGSVVNGGVAIIGNFFSHSQILTIPVTNTSGTNTLTQTGLNFTLGSYYVGKSITGTGIPGGTTITAVTGSGGITISNNTTSAVTSVNVANNAGVLWGNVQGAVAMGNYALYGLHDMTSGSWVNVNDYSVNGPISNTASINTASGYSEGTWAPTVRGASSANYTWTNTTAKATKNGNQITYMLKGTLTSTGTNGADALYIPSSLPWYCQEVGDLVGSCEVVGSSTNNGISPLYTSAIDKVQSSVNVIPANTAGQSWSVRAFFTFITPYNGV